MKGKDAADKAQLIGETEREFDSVKKRFKGKIETQESDLADVLRTIREGEEVRLVECIERKDYQRHIVEYIYEGEVMEERAMTIDERQTEMKLVENPTTVVTKDGEREKMQRHLTKEQKELRDVMREETSKKTAKDLSNNGH